MDESTRDSVVCPQRHPSLTVAALTVAASAYAGAFGLATGTLSLGDRLDGRLPLSSPVLAGVALLLLIAVPFTVLASRAWSDDQRAGATSMVAGFVTVGWVAVQLAFIREFSFFQPVYATVGAAFVVVGRRLRVDVVPDVDTAAVARFLEGRRIALIGASDDPKKFSTTVLRELVAHGYDVVPVNPKRAEVAGLPSAAGGPGAFSAETVDWCREHDVDVVAGACPLMFLEPVAGLHRAHLAVRRFAGAVD